MRPFDWMPLLRRHHIHYIERGANVKRGEVNIRCPWCGSADPSQHLGINLDSGWYSCWRHKQGHSGKSPVRLIMMLLKVSYGKARELAGLGDDYVDPDGFDAMAARLMGRIVPPSRPTRAREVELDRHFIPITDAPRTRRWWNYLYGRGFAGNHIGRLCDQYGLMAARDGSFAMRLIIPYLLDGMLVTWTGRAIAASSIRYKDLSIEQSAVPVKELLYNHDAVLEGGKILVLVEGPFDALKVDFYGAPYGVRAVAMSTNSMTGSQMFDLEAASGQFDHVVAMLDNKTDFGLVDSMRVKQNLSFLDNLLIKRVPFDRPDPGELSPGEVADWARIITKELK